MKALVLFILLIVIMSFPYLKGEEPAEKEDLFAYLLQPGELKDWHPSEKPQYAKGEDLYLLIDGGAEIYLEYGFRQAVVQGFKNKNGKSFNLELYEMKDAEAAYGIYTFRRGNAGKALNIGNEGLLEDYYLNFWKGNFLVTIIGFDSDKETLDGIIHAAEVVSAKIKAEGKKPDLLNMLPNEYKDKLKPNGITYLKGNLALFGKYEFDTSDIFGIKEGVLADYGDFKLFIFNYSDKKECKKWFLNAVQKLQTNKRFKNFHREEDGLRMVAEKGIPLSVHCEKQYLFISIGASRLSEN